MRNGGQVYASQHLHEMRLGKTPTTIKNKRVYKQVITLDIVAEKYHKDRKLYLNEKNLQKTISLYKRRIQPYIGSMNIEEVKEKHIKEIMLDLSDKLSNRTINIVVEKISTIFNFGYKEGIYTGKNPAKSIEKLSANNDRVRYLSKDEIKELMAEVENNDILYLFTYLALTTGGRLTALCSVKVKDINLTDMIIELSDDKNESKYKAFIYENQKFLTILEQQLSNRNSNDLLFGDKTVIGYKRYFQRELSKIFKRLFNQEIEKLEKSDDKNKVAEARRDKVVIHTLRHTFASQLVIKGTPIYTVKKLMNHSDIKMTERYAKLGKDSGREFVNDIF